MKIILEKIIKYNTIILARHKLPDLDALGSQFGLGELLKSNYPEKRILLTGTELPEKYSFLGKLDELSIEDYKGSLYISLDTASLKLLDDTLQDNAEYKIKIDHHQPREDFFDYQYVDTSMESNCSLIVELAKFANWKFNKVSATALISGMISDSGRFLYDSTTSETFKRASFLLEYDVDLSTLYKKMYMTTIEQKKLESYVLQNFQVKENVAFIIYEESVIERYNTTLSYIKSGTVNMMSNIEGIDAWMTFTKVGENVYVELRGYKPVVNVCIKHGGGGHLLACGCTIKESEITEFIDEVIEELKC